MKRCHLFRAAAWATVCVCLIVVAGSPAGTISRHSWTSNLAAGDFDGDGAADAAWVLPSGDIQFYSPLTGAGWQLTGTKAYAVVGADVSPGVDGVHELVYLKQVSPSAAASQEIHVYSYPSRSDVTRAPEAALRSSRLTAGDWNNDGDDGVVVTGNAGNLYGSEPTPTGWVWNFPSANGQLAAYVAADFNEARPGKEFGGHNVGGAVYWYDGAWHDTNAGGVTATSAGKVRTDVPDAQIIALVGTQIWNYNTTTGWAPLPGAGVGVGAGSVDPALAGKDEWMVIGSAPTYPLYRYANYSAWQQIGTGTNWGDFVAADFNKDGTDEILAIKRDGTVHYMDPKTMAEFQPVSAPTAALAKTVPVTDSLKLWLDASDAGTVQTDGSGRVQLWRDKSGWGNDAVQADPAKRPTPNATAVNGQPGVRFDPATADGLAVEDTLSLARPYTVFTVDQYYGGQQGRTLQSRDGGVNWLTGKWGGKNTHFANGFVNDQNASPAGTFNPVIGEAVGYGASSAYLINGINRTNNPGPTGSPGHLGLGSSGTFNAEQSQSDVAEVIAFDRALTHYERSQVGLYLRGKYGITGYTAYNLHLATRAQAFVGGDVGEGLDMQGKFLYAVNARGPGGMKVGDATFTTDAGIVSSEYEIINWIAPAYGYSADDLALQTVMQSIRWTATTDGGQDTLTANLPGLVPGRTYKVQMMFGDAAAARHFAVDIEGSRVLGDFQAAAATGTTANRGVVVSHQFVATDDTLNIVLDGRGLSGGDINPILQAVTVEDRGVRGKTWAGTFNGAAPGQGLKLDGDFLYAVNVGGAAGSRLRVGGALFTPDTQTPGCTVNAENHIPNWINPNYGPGQDNANLATVMQSIRWTDTHDAVGNYREGEALSVDLEGLEVGQLYLLQLLFGENPSGRGFDVVLNDVLVYDGFSPTAAGANANTGVVLSHRFIADSTDLHIVLDGYPTSFGDRNPILQGFTLQQIPEPATLVLLGVALAGLSAGLRRRLRKA